MAPAVNISRLLAPGGTLSATFRPPLSGLVTAVAVSTPPSDAPAATAPALTLELLPPGHASPVTATSTAPPLATGASVAHIDVDAAAADLAADWVAQVRSDSGTPVEVQLTVRFRTSPSPLGMIDHIVVLMQENRSFDHMLGYLSVPTSIALIPPGATTALATATAPVSSATITLDHNVTAGELTVHGNWACRITNQTNKDINFDITITITITITYSPLPLQSSMVQVTIASGTTHALPFRPGAPGELTVWCTLVDPPGHLTSQTENTTLATLRIQRPGETHPAAPTSAQIGETNLGASYDVKNSDLTAPGDWHAIVANLTLQDLTFDCQITSVAAPPSPATVLGYYSAVHAPTYDFLARNYGICDQWFASLPTDTWPNRLYSLTGGSGGLLTTPSDSDITADPPGYLLTTIFEVLQDTGVEWGVFFGNVPFPLIFKRLAQDATCTAQMHPLTEFYARAATGDLPEVSWIEPHFSDATFDPAPDDDHPPGDITRGQVHVQKVYEAFAAGPAWTRTLLLVIYDEHGGLYDHVTPPGTPDHPGPGEPPAPGGPADDDPALARYGLRVPAFVVSPWVPIGAVSHDTYDHTSVLATILRRFCADPSGAVPDMGTRVRTARDVGGLLALPLPIPRPAAP
jgi:phospholipase C